MSFPAYEDLIDTEFLWLGKVPSHWELCPVGSCFRERRDKVSDTDYPPLSVTKNGIVPQLENAAKTDDNDNRRLVCAGDFVINSRSDRKGSSGMASEDGSVSLINTVIAPNQDIEIEFAHHLFRSATFQEEYYRFGKGIVADLWSTNYSAMKRICLAVPPLDEQKAISSFLDVETSKIDGLVSEQRRLIELLKEKRQAVISHAVTKGLNPNAPMKPSGIQWLGDVPQHWSVKRVKHLTASIKAGPFGSSLTKDVYVASGYRVYGQEQVIPNDFTIGDYYIDQAKYDELSQCSVAPGDVLISCVGTFGKIAIVPDDAEPGIINPRLLRLRCNSSIAARYLVEVLRSQVTFEQFSLLSRGGTMDVINIGTLSSVAVPLPPKDEQDELVSFVHSEIEKFDSLQTEAERAIELLQERRTALISAAVTGKIDVREFADQETP